MRRAVLIVNPAASGVTDERVARVQTELGTAGPVETLRTERPGQAAELAAAACARCDAVYVLAGDGGFNEVLNGMLPEVPVGFLAAGASNVLPRALGLPGDAVAAARRLASAERRRRISLGVATYVPAGTPPAGPVRRRFGFAAGVGLDAEVVRAVDRRGRSRGRRASDLAFAAELARALARRHGHLENALTVEGSGRAAFAVAANCDPYTYAGPLPVHAAPLARFELGIDLVAPARLGPAGLVRLAWWVLFHPAHPGSPAVHYLHDRDEIRVRCDGPLPLEADGEDLGDVLEVVFAAERGAVSVLV